jgi:hypothetical protein
MDVWMLGKGSAPSIVINKFSDVMTSLAQIERELPVERAPDPVHKSVLTQSI